MRFWVTVFGVFSLFLDESIFSESCSTILQYSEEHLSFSGVLKNSDGFVYVDVEDVYVHELMQFIQEEGFIEPPYFGKTGLVGAHITMIYPQEMEKYSLQDIEECGETISFTLKGCYIAEPPRWKEVEQVYMVTVEAPRLDEIREKYGLPKREYDFHITIGVKYKRAP